MHTNINKHTNITNTHKYKQTHTNIANAKKHGLCSTDSGPYPAFL